MPRRALLLLMSCLLPTPAWAELPQALAPGETLKDVRFEPLRTLEAYFPFQPVDSKQAWQDRAEAPHLLRAHGHRLKRKIRFECAQRVRAHLRPEPSTYSAHARVGSEHDISKSEIVFQILWRLEGVARTVSPSNVLSGRNRNCDSKPDSARDPTLLLRK